MKIKWEWYFKVIRADLKMHVVKCLIGCTKWPQNYIYTS